MSGQAHTPPRELFTMSPVAIAEQGNLRNLRVQIHQSPTAQQLNAGLWHANTTELARANEALKDAKHRMGMLERQIKGLLAEEKRTKENMQVMLYNQMVKARRQLIWCEKVRVRCQHRVYTACKETILKNSEKMEAMIRQLPEAPAEITISEFSPGAVEVFLCSLHTEPEFFISESRFPLRDSLEALKMLHYFGCPPALIAHFLTALRQRLHKCWMESPSAIPAVMHKLIQLRDSDFGPDLGAFATLQHDIILRLPNIKEVWAAITQLKGIEVFTREFTLVGARLEDCVKAEGFIPNLGLIAIASVTWPKVEVTMPHGPRHSAYQWSLTCTRNEVEGYYFKTPDEELLKGHSKTVDFENYECCPNDLFQFTVSFTDAGYWIYVLSEWVKMQREYDAFFSEAINGLTPFDTVDLLVYFEGQAFQEGNGDDIATVESAREIRKVCAEVCRLLTFDQIGEDAGSFSKDTMRHMFRALLTRPVSDPEETSRLLLSNLMKWHALRGNNANTTDLISFIEEFQLLDKMTIDELYKNSEEAEGISDLVPDGVVAKVLYERLTFLTSNKARISQDEEVENQDTKRIKGA